MKSSPKLIGIALAIVFLVGCTTSTATSTPFPRVLTPPPSDTPLPPLPPTATSYYLNASGNDASPGTSAQPWRTLARVQTGLNSGDFQPGDQILFARGESFTGTLTFDQNDNGTAVAPITFGAYGTGTAPVLSGLQTLNGWQSLGNNQWRVVCNTCNATPALLVIDGVPQPIARWPNRDEADEGYRYITSASNNSSLTDSTLAASPNWTGGEVVVRSIAWVLDRLPIVAHQGGTLTMATPASYDLQPGWGYFIQNHLAALDRDGEWVYAANDKTITLQWPVNPSGELVEVPVISTLIEINGSQHLRFQNMEMRGAQQDLVRAHNCTNLQFEQVQLRLAGNQALEMNDCPNSQVTQSTVANSMNNGLNLNGCGNCQVRQTIVERIGLFAGLGGNGDGQYIGVQITGVTDAPAMFEYNAVAGIGYLAVRLDGNAVARYNVVRDWNRTKMDGAGIYTYRIQNVLIERNLVLEARGSTAGTPWNTTATHGIYIDDNSEFVTVTGNIIAQISGAGVHLHNTRDVTVTNNLIFATDEAGILLTDDDLGTYDLAHSLVSGNTVMVRGVPMLNIYSSQTDALFTTLGTIDTNRYCDPFGPPQFSVELPGAGGTRKSLAQWQAAYGRDLASTVCADRYPSHIINGTPGSNRVGNGTFNSNLDDWFGWPQDTLSATWETGRLDGGSLRFGYNGPAPTIHYDYPIGAVQGGQTVRLQLSTVAIIGTPIITAYLRQRDSPYTQVSTTESVWVDGQQTEHEIFFNMTANQSDTLLIFEMNSPGAVVGLDNVVLELVDATVQTLDSVTRFDVNESGSAKTITLDGYDYRGVDGVLYPAGSSLVLQPYSGIVLLR